MKKIIFGAVTGLLLTACSGGPSNSDIEDALKESAVASMEAVAKLNSQMGKLFGQKAKEFDPNSIEIDVTSVDNMKETDDGAYTATVTVEMEMEVDGKTESEKSVVQVTMREADGNWILENERKIK